MAKILETVFGKKDLDIPSRRIFMISFSIMIKNLIFILISKRNFKNKSNYKIMPRKDYDSLIFQV